MATRGTDRRRAAGVVAVLALVVGLSACGGSDDAAPVTEAPTTAPVTDPPETTAAPTTEAPDTTVPVTDPPGTTEPEQEPEPAGAPELVWRVEHEGRPAAVAVSPDLTTVFVGVHATYAYRLADGVLYDVIVTRQAPRSVALSPDGAVVATGMSLYGTLVTTSEGGVVPGLEAAPAAPGVTGAELGDGFDNVAAFDPTGSTLAAGDRTGAVGIWDLTDGTLTRALSDGTAATGVMSIAHDPTGSVLAVVHTDCVLNVWDLASDSIRHRLELESGDGSCGLATALVAFAPDGESMYVATRSDRNAVVQVVDVSTGEVTDEFETLDRVRAIDVSPGGSMLLVAARLGTVIYDLEAATERYTFDEEFDALASEQPLDAVFTPDGGYVVIARQTGDLELWRLPGADDLPVVERQPCDPVPIPGDVLFDTASAALRGDADPVLTELATQLADGFPVATLTFVGHTDSRGSDAANQQLSLERATAVEAWFTAWASASGVDGWTTRVDGRGASEPKVADVGGDGEFLPEAGALNRRVEILIDAEGCAT